MGDSSAPSPGDAGENGELIGSGSFVLDRKLALEKLMRFQLAHPGMYALVLLRCAAAGGASQIFLKHEEGRRVEFRFDGSAFSEEELGDPYACLFRELTPETTRNRELATALLSLLRLNPSEITVRSGKGNRRRLLRVTGLDRQAQEPCLDPETETVLSAVQPAGAPEPLWGPELDALLDDRCRMSAVPVYRNGKLLPALRPEESPRESHGFEDKGVRGQLFVPEDPSKSELRLHRWGVFVEKLSRRLPEVQVDGFLNDDRLRLNTSQGAVVRNSRLDGALAAASAAAVHLALRSTVLQAERLEEAPPERRRALLEGAGADAVRARWLRSAAADRLIGAPKSWNSPLQKSLAEAPLFLGADLEPLSLLELCGARDRNGGILHSQEAFAGLAAAAGTLWSFSPLELAALRPWFSQLKDARAALHEARRRAARPEPGAAPEAPGDADKLERDLRRWLTALSRLGACALPPRTIEEFRLGPGSGSSLVGRTPESAYFLDAAHPLVRELCSSEGLSREARIPYLLSLLVSGLNRLSPEFTDAADARFSLALAEFVLEEPGRG